MSLAKERTKYNAILLMILIALAGAFSACSTSPNIDDYYFREPWPHYLYLPEAYTTDRAWPLFIGVHGSASDGRSCWRTWQPYADSKGFVLLCPELADSDGRLHQLRANTRLLDILGRLYEEQTLAPKIFLAGFSAGGQFVHGYAFTYPNYVVGVSAIAPGNYYEPSSTSRHIPFVVIVGDGDDPGNVENANQLAWLLGQAGYSVELHVLEGEGHTVSEEAINITLGLYDHTARR